jgi:hypothetical protein
VEAAAPAVGCLALRTRTTLKNVRRECRIRVLEQQEATLRRTLITLILVLSGVALAARPVPALVDAASAAQEQEPAASAAVSDSSAALPQLTEEQKRELERIGTLGYTVGGAETRAVRGLSIRKAGAFDGYTVYVSADFPGAFLVDMDGHIIHRWQERGANQWTRAWVYPDGGILGISAYPARLMRLDRESNVIWEYGGEDLRAHHDVVVSKDGTIYVLMRAPRVMDWFRPIPMLDDMVCILEPDGALVREVRCISIPTAFYESDFASWVTSPQFAMKTSDPFHTNSVEVLDGTVPLPEFRAGNILVSVRHLDCLAVIDPDSSKVVWANRGRWQRQHEARVTPEGTIMIFDNRKRDGQSRVVEYDAVDDEIVWSYTAPDFFSRGTGAEQLLPNDNVLITESEKGRVFEITREGDVVWEYWNPSRLGGGDTIVRITRAFRLPAAYFEGAFAEYLSSGGDTSYRPRDAVRD